MSAPRLFNVTDRPALLICISIAAVCWLLNKMTLTYESEYEVTMNYVLPSNECLTTPAPKTIKVSLEGSGWDLFSAWFRRKRREMTINVNSTTNDLVLERRIAGIFPNLKIKGINPTNISLQTEREITKVLPVALRYHLNFTEQYHLKNQPILSAANVTVHGAASVLKNIDSLISEPIVLDNINNTKTGEVKLDKAYTEALRIDLNTPLTYTINVEALTEKTFTLPITIKQTSGKQNLFLLQNTVTVTCLLGVSAFDSLNLNQCHAFADAEHPIKAGVLPVSISLPSRFTQNYHYNPQEVEVLISK